MADAYDGPLAFCFADVHWVHHKVAFWRRVPARLVGDVRPHPDDQPTHFLWTFCSGVLLELLDDGWSHLICAVPGNPPKGRAAVEPKRSLQPVSRLLHLSLVESVVATSYSSATGPPE